MKVQDGEFIVTAQELAIAAAVLEVDQAALTVIPPDLWSDDEERQFIDEAAIFDDAVRNGLAAAVATLAAPARVASFHYTVADAAVSRHLLAWPSAGDELVFVTQAVGAWRIGVRPAEHISDLIAHVLVARDRIEPFPLGVEVSGAATLVFLAALDNLRLARLQSQLAHASPQTLLTLEAVAALLGMSATEDFRSPLFFFEKLLPMTLDVEPSQEEVAAAFDELVAAELVEPAAEGMFILSELGEAAAEAVFHEVSKVGLRLSESLPDGIIGHDALLFVRSPFRLMLFEVDGGSGAIAALDSEQWHELVDRLLEAPQPAAVAASRLPAPGVE